MTLAEEQSQAFKEIGEELLGEVEKSAETQQETILGEEGELQDIVNRAMGVLEMVETVCESWSSPVENASE
jgi:hypothetical protein